ncbi:hypothetical protein MWU54_15205 [Marivita sp. S6314]|uniref:hypothetical protein n=1 Tax=Marivita sp. S6314 TaxID=2926406 RepID=UPI001FF36F3B|nr:hypothetical protein [Marivita sp. S6314]MCK0151388.1 hypothetical protein [Marivita sp. S6314]
MRDDRNKWAASGTLGDGFEIGDVVVSRVRVSRQLLVSGPRVRTQIDVPTVGWPEICEATTYALSLRRDRVLVVNGDPVEDGWDDATSQARSDASDLYSVFDLSGRDAFNVVKRGTEISMESPSRSVLRRFFGLQVMLYRVQAEDRFRLHVARASEDALLGYLESAAGSAWAARSR